MNLPSRVRASKQKVNAFFSLVLLFSLQTEGVARVKVGLLTSNNTDLVCLPMPKDPIKNTFPGVPSYVGFS